MSLWSIHRSRQNGNLLPGSGLLCRSEHGGSHAQSDPRLGAIESTAQRGHFSPIPTVQATFFFLLALDCGGERSASGFVPLSSVFLSLACCQLISNSSTS